MKETGVGHSLSQVARILWGATLLTIPVTSFRYFPAGEGTFVRPLAFLPLAALIPILAIRLVRGETELPRPTVLVPLAAFVLVAVLASVVGILLDPIPMRGQDAVGRIARAWITILMGLGFLVGAIWMNRDESDLRFSVRWLLIGFCANILWSGLQAATFYLHILPKELVTQWQRLFSLRELIRTNRISGMAYEPAWLAGQIATVYLPWLLAAALTRVRAFRVRWFEVVLLAAAALMLLATFSRGGILTAGISTILVIIFGGTGRAAVRMGVVQQDGPRRRRLLDAPRDHRGCASGHWGHRPLAGAEGLRVPSLGIAARRSRGVPGAELSRCPRGLYRERYVDL